MLKNTVCIASAIAFALLLSFSAIADDAAKSEAKEEKAAKKEKVHEYIGAGKCKICHKPEFESWEKTVHANAFELLSDEEKKNEECIGCHVTGTTAKGEVLTGVQCEACHGAGADYKKKSIMEDLKLATENGLIIPDEETCVKCHNKKSPTFKEFDFEKFVNKEGAIHARKTKAEEKETKSEE
jgi:hypothetical protein